MSLPDSGYKVLTNVMAERLSTWAEKEKKLSESQAGFNKGRGTREHLFVLNALIESKLKSKGGKLYVCLIDFKAAFDTISRRRLLKKLKEIGINGRMHRMIASIYEDTRAEVQIGGNLTRSFKTKQGVRQGCALSSLLFDLYIEDLDKEWEKRDQGGVVIGGCKIKVLKYADDVALVADSAKELDDMMRTLEKYVTRNELIVNVKKTKIMVFRKGGQNKKGEEWRFKGEAIEVVKEFKYLGYIFTTRNTCRNHVGMLAGKAQKAANITWGLMKRTGRAE